MQSAFIAWKDASSRKILSPNSPSHTAPEDREFPEVASDLILSPEEPGEMEDWEDGLGPFVPSPFEAANVRVGGEFTMISPEQHIYAGSRVSSTISNEVMPLSVDKDPVSSDILVPADRPKKGGQRVSSENLAQVEKAKKRKEKFAQQRRQAEREIQLLSITIAKEQETAEYCTRMEKQLDDEIALMMRPVVVHTVPPLPNSVDRSVSSEEDTHSRVNAELIMVPNGNTSKIRAQRRSKPRIEVDLFMGSNAQTDVPRVSRAYINTAAAPQNDPKTPAAGKTPNGDPKQSMLIIM